MKKAVIVDIDGTLTNCDHRVHHVQKDPKDWRSFSQEMISDTLHDWCNDLITSLQQAETEIIFMTGRGEKYRDLTIEWLTNHSISYSKLYMRARGDYREDSVVKKEIYEDTIQQNYNILFVLEDRASVVAMWRNLGLTCLQCAEGNF